MIHDGPEWKLYSLAVDAHYKAVEVMQRVAYHVPEAMNFEITRSETTHRRDLIPFSVTFYAPENVSLDFLRPDVLPPLK